MALAICLLFDEDTDRMLHRLWARLEDVGIPTLLTHTHRNHVAHLSYAVLRDYDTDRVADAVEALPDHPASILRFDTIGLFRRGRAALVPAPSTELLTRQERVVRVAEGTGAQLHRHYRPGFWTPHCTLSTRTRRDDLPRLAAVVYDLLPVAATVVGAALVDTTTGARRRLVTLP